MVRTCCPGSSAASATSSPGYDDLTWDERFLGSADPVTGGVGPMTITMLMKNTLQAARLTRQ